MFERVLGELSWLDDLQDKSELLHGGVVRGDVVGAAGRGRAAVGAAGGRGGRRVPPQVVGAPAVPQQRRLPRRQVPRADLVRLS